MMWTFLFATCFAYTTWHYRQCVMRTALCGTCFTCFTFWRCHFSILLIYNCSILFNSLQFASKSLIRYNMGTEHTMVMHQTNNCTMIVQPHIKPISLLFQRFYCGQLKFCRSTTIILGFTINTLVNIRQ